MLFLFLQTKTAQIVGVAGTDVPVEDIKKLLLLHEVSAVQQFVLHSKSTLQVFGFTYANTCDIMRKLMQCFDQDPKKYLISIFYMKNKYLCEAYNQNGFICKALVIEIIIIF